MLLHFNNVMYNRVHKSELIIFLLIKLLHNFTRLYYNYNKNIYLCY